MSFEVPNWYDHQDRRIYQELSSKSEDELTEKENNFLKDMYYSERFHYEAQFDV